MVDYLKQNCFSRCTKRPEEGHDRVHLPREKIAKIFFVIFIHHHNYMCIYGVRAFQRNVRTFSHLILENKRAIVRYFSGHQLYT